MKYILVPPIKFIAALILSIWAVFVTILFIIIYMIWEFKFPKEDIEYRDHKYNYNAARIYQKRPEHNVIYPSMLHFVWNKKGREVRYTV